MYALYCWLGRLIYWLILPYRVTWLVTTDRVGVVLTDQAGRIFLTKNWLGNGVWRLPGGGVKSGESPAATAVRELAEELGLKLAPADLVYLGSTRRGAWSGQWSALRTRSGRATIELNRRELIAGQWFDPVDLDGLQLDGTVKAALGWAGLWPLSRPPGSGAPSTRG